MKLFEEKQTTEPGLLCAQSETPVNRQQDFHGHECMSTNCVSLLLVEAAFLGLRDTQST